MSEVLIIILGVWSGFNILYPMICLITEYPDALKFLPGDLRKFTKMNLFGCWFVSILMFILLPITYIVRFLVWCCFVKKER